MRLEFSHKYDVMKNTKNKCSKITIRSFLLAREIK